MSLQETREKIIRLQEQRSIHLQTKASIRDEVAGLDDELVALQTAIFTVSEMARIMRERTKTVIEELVTSAINSVYTSRPFRYTLDFTFTAAGRMDCHMKVMEGDEEFDPVDEMGGGMVDVISFALRVVMWHLNKPRTRPTIILDEPFKFMGHGDLQERAGQLLRTISEKLGLQFIIITHESLLMNFVDRAYQITHNGTESKALQIVPKPKERVRA